MPSEAVGVKQGRLRRDAVGARDLTQAAAGDERVKDGLQELGALEPVGRAEALVAEVTPAMTAAVTLNALGLGVASEEAVLDEAPAHPVTMELTPWVRTERGSREGFREVHAPRSSQGLVHPQFP